MPEVFCNTSPMQYLHQLGLLHLLPELYGTIILSPAVIEELAEGRFRNVDLPNPDILPWITVRAPKSVAVLSLITDLGAGEREVLALALESPDASVILDDKLGRQMAKALGIPLKGTLAVLLEGKRQGRVSQILPILDRLETLRFRLAHHTRDAVLRIAGEK